MSSSMNRRAVMTSGMALLATSSCGYLLYPGRRGRTGGRIDIPVLIIDLLWFIPGVLPGVICLIVDFTKIWRGPAAEFETGRSIFLRTAWCLHDAV